VPLLEQHKSAAIAEISHCYFHQHWAQLVNRPPALVATPNWLSINMIAYDWSMGVALSAAMGSPAPSQIAGRKFATSRLLGDEAAVNTVPRLICRGLVASHLTFGPQEAALTAETLGRWRRQYHAIADSYLQRESSNWFN
jgi:hypothetical protein